MGAFGGIESLQERASKIHGQIRLSHQGSVFTAALFWKDTKA